ncbi:MAG: amidohydrolase family protein, partial [Candidatus Hadarchaeales archaeon]
MADLVIRNARLVLPEGIVQGELAIDNGVITEISRVRLPKGETEINANGKLVMPGVMDVHAHIYDPRYLKREDFRNGTAAAAAGGVTSVIVMPLDTPMVMVEELQKVIEVGQKHGLIDFSLHAGNFTADIPEYLCAAAGIGIKSFKMFTCAPYRIGETTLERLMSTIKNIGGIAFVHAEDDKIIRKNTKRLLKEGRSDPLAHVESRPNEAEEKAIKKMIELAKKTECNLHLAHVTTHEGVELVNKAKSKHVRLTAETCPHYLIFTKEDMEKLGPYLKV